MKAGDWIERARSLDDSELAGFRRRICVTGAHIGTANIGRCSRCGEATASGTMTLCRRCGEELGVCQYDGRQTGWGPASAGDPEAQAARWLALYMRGYSTERAAALRALHQFALPELEEAVREAPPEGRSPTVAEFNVGFAAGLPEGLAVGEELLGARVVGVDEALRFATVRPEDAREFEAAAGADPSIEYVELNRQVADLRAPFST